MSKEISSITKLILQRTSEEGQGFMDHKNPAVLSCGGMYLPRPKTALPPGRLSCFESGEQTRTDQDLYR